MSRLIFVCVCVSIETNNKGVCVSSLVGSGPSLIGHGIAESVVAREIPANLILEMEQGSSQNVLQNIRTLTFAFPRSLSISNILVYCGFQAALQWSQSDPSLPEV